MITIERTWFGCVHYNLHPSSGRWISTKCPPPPPPPPLMAQAVTYPLAGPPEVQAITSSLVRVLFDIPYQIDGVAGLK